MWGGIGRSMVFLSVVMINNGARAGILPLLTFIFGWGLVSSAISLPSIGQSKDNQFARGSLSTLGSGLILFSVFYLLTPAFEPTKKGVVNNPGLAVYILGWMLVVFANMIV